MSEAVQNSKANEAARTALTEKKIPFLLNEPLKKHTTFQIGGPAALFCIPHSQQQLIDTLAILESCKTSVFLLGNGSNVLFKDEGYQGAVVAIQYALASCKIKGNTLVAGAGLPLLEACTAAAEASLTGIEFAYGIPGSVGGAVYMNAGAYGGEMKDVLQEVRCITYTGHIETLKLEELMLGYRHSVFHSGKRCILDATFRLQEGEQEDIWHKMDELIEKREAKQPLDMPSAGSAFKRPEGAFAGALIDQCGLRGFRVGDAAISEKHCGFIVNLGKATCSDILELAEHVSHTVKKQTGFVLEKEIRVIEPY